MCLPISASPCHCPGITRKCRTVLDAQGRPSEIDAIVSNAIGIAFGGLVKALVEAADAKPGKVIVAARAGPVRRAAR